MEAMAHLVRWFTYQTWWLSIAMFGLLRISCGNMSSFYCTEPFRWLVQHSEYIKHYPFVIITQSGHLIEPVAWLVGWLVLKYMGQKQIMISMDGLVGKSAGNQKFSPWNLGGSYRFSLKAGQVCSQGVHHPWNKKMSADSVSLLL